VEDFVNKLVPIIRGHAKCNGTPVFVIWSNKENRYSTMSEDKKKAYNNTHFDLMVDFYPEHEKHSWMMSRSDKPILKSTVIPWSEGTIQDIAYAVCQMAYEQRHGAEGGRRENGHGTLSVMDDDESSSCRRAHRLAGRRNGPTGG
jgi:hypothetical protein